MNERVFRCLAITLVAFALLTVLPVAAAAGEGPRNSPQDRGAMRAVAPFQELGCHSCDAAFQKCSTTCFGLVEGMGKCLTACDNAAAICTCDQAIGLRSEELVNFPWPAMYKSTCHGNVSCQPYYPSCASWSTYSDCDTPYCGIGIKCGDCEYIEGREFCSPGPAWKTPRERFRVCFDQYGNSCTEWQKTILSYCGCE